MRLTIPGLNQLNNSIQQLIGAKNAVNNSATQAAQSLGGPNLSLRDMQAQIDAAKNHKRQIQAAIQDNLVQQSGLRLAYQRLSPTQRQNSMIPTQLHQLQYSNTQNRAQLNAANASLQQWQQAMQQALLNTGPTISAQTGSRLGASIIRAISSGNPSSALSTLSVGAGLGTAGSIIGVATAVIAGIGKILETSMALSKSYSDVLHSGGLGSAVDAARITKLSDVLGIDQQSLANKVYQEPMGYQSLLPKIDAIINAKSRREADLIARNMGLPEIARIYDVAKRKPKEIESILRGNNYDSSLFDADKIEASRELEQKWSELKRKGGEWVRNITAPIISEINDSGITSSIVGALNPIGDVKRIIEKLIWPNGKEEKSDKASKKLEDAADSIYRAAESFTNKVGLVGGGSTGMNHVIPAAWGWYSHSQGLIENPKSLGAFEL